MAWIKKKLIFVPDGKISEMISHASIPFADVHNETTLRIYFSSRNPNGQSIPYSLNLDIRNFSIITPTDIKNLFDLGQLGTFDDNGIMPACVVNYHNKKYLYYIGWNLRGTVPYHLAIGLAISNDGGDTYLKFSKGPVCDRGLDEPFFNTAPFVMIDNGKWRMWYVSCTGWEKINNHPEPLYHIKYAESDDGVVWTKHNIVCIECISHLEAIGRPCVLIEDGIYKMWYSYRLIKDYRTDRNMSYRIGYAESIDGINWLRKDQEVGIERSKAEWDSQMMEYCHVVKIQNKKYMFYNGNGFGASGFGYAVWG